jgi:hypothetical protein
MHNNSDQNRAWRVALRALEEAEANNAALLNPNFVQNQDNAGTGTATVTVTTAGIKKKGSGKMKVTASIAGESTGPGTMTATLLRDATPIGQTQAVTALSANDAFALAPMFVDTAPDGASHTYELSVNASAGNITCAAKSAQIIVEEL